MNAWYKKFSSQPHQPFFTNGVLFFALFMILFFVTYSNILTIHHSVLTYHAYSLIFVVFIQFFLGFLFVVFPKFLMQAEIEIDLYMRQFFLYFIGSLGVFVSIIFFDNIVILFQVLLLFAQILSFKLLYSIHKKSIMQDKTDTKWVLISFMAGLVAHFLFIVSEFSFNESYIVSKVAINSGFYLFLFLIIFTISQRMIPFFTTSKAPDYKINKSENLLTLVFVFLALKVVLLSFDNAKLNLIADVPLFIIITKELIRWKLPFFKVPAIVRVLFLGLYWIPVAFFISILESLMAFYDPSIVFEKAVIHTLALGYFITLLVGFGTRVILGHSGSIIHANNFAIFIFISVQIITILRIFTSFSLNWGLNYMALLNLTASLLIIGLLLWSSKYIVILLKGK